jgi:hypothetical protein
MAIALAILVPGTALACITPIAPGECEGPDASLDGWNDIRRPDDINPGNDLGSNTYPSINFTRSTGSAGDVWLTLYPAGSNYSNDLNLCVDVLTKPFNNRKGAGVLFLYNATFHKGLAVLVTNAGNTDILYLGVADQVTGAFTVLKSVSLGAGIAEKAWYRLWVSVGLGNGGTEVYVTARVYRHLVSTSPYSPLNGQVGSDLTYDEVLPAGILTFGDIGLAAYAKLAVVDSSATRFNYDPLYVN